MSCPIIFDQATSTWPWVWTLSHCDFVCAVPSVWSAHLPNITDYSSGQPWPLKLGWPSLPAHNTLGRYTSCTREFPACSSPTVCRASPASSIITVHQSTPCTHHHLVSSNTPNLRYCGCSRKNNPQLGEISCWSYCVWNGIRKFPEILVVLAKQCWTKYLTWDLCKKIPEQKER